MTNSDTILRHKRHALCNCLSVTFNQTLPGDVWIRIFNQLDYFDLVNIKNLSKFLSECSKVRSLQEALFVAPLDERSTSNLEEDDEVQLHPLISEFSLALRRESSLPADELEPPAGLSGVKRFDWQEDNLARLGNQNATNPPLDRMRFLDTEWTAESLRDFCSESDSYDCFEEEGYTKKVDLETKSSPPTKAMQKATLNEASSSSVEMRSTSKPITVANVLQALMIHHSRYREEEAKVECGIFKIQWKDTESADDSDYWVKNLEAIEEEWEYEDDWQRQLDWDKYFKSIELQDGYIRREQIELECERYLHFPRKSSSLALTRSSQDGSLRVDLEFAEMRTVIGCTTQVRLSRKDGTAFQNPKSVSEENASVLFRTLWTA